MPLHTNHQSSGASSQATDDAGRVVLPARPAPFSIALVRGANLCMAWAEPIPTEAHAATRNHEA